MMSADYDPKFFATVQNKLHYAISGLTAAEIIAQRVDSKKPYMGLTSWKNSPRGEIRKTDVGIAKNYLDEKELNLLNRIVTMYLDYMMWQWRWRKANMKNTVSFKIEIMFPILTVK